MSDPRDTVIPLRLGLRELVRMCDHRPTMAEMWAALAPVPNDQAVSYLVRRLHTAGYCALTGLPDSAHPGQATRLSLTTLGWRAYRRHLWRDPTVMDVGLDRTYIDRACAWKRPQPAADVEPDPATLAKLLSDNELGSSGV